MTVTDISIKLIDNEKVKGIVSVVFDKSFVVHNIKIIKNKDKMFLAMPSRKNSKGIFKNYCHPINSELRNAMEQAVMDKYNKMLSDKNISA